ncbi:MAG: RecB family exonuclease, partial [Acidobacteriota bacterium]
AEKLIPFEEKDALPPQPGLPDDFAAPSIIQTQGLKPSISTVRVTGLGDYERCPKLFKYKYVDGHPGIGEGGTGAARLGTLTHLALEKEITDPDALRRLVAGMTDEETQTAIDFANVFRSHAEFKEVNGCIASKEVDLSLEVDGLILTGVADAVGDDFVLDYKTDKEMEPEHHKLQLWAYTKALGKSKGYLAYLRHDKLYRFESDELMGLDETAKKIVAGIREGDFAATPSITVCRFCSYREICDEKSEEVGEV